MLQPLIILKQQTIFRKLTDSALSILLIIDELKFFQSCGLSFLNFSFIDFSKFNMVIPSKM